MKKGLLLLVSCMVLSCTPKTDAPAIHISLIDSGNTLKITGLNYAIMQDVNRDSSNGWQNLLQVYRMPADTDMKDYQPMQPGSYAIKDSAIIFKPDTPFAKHQLYFMRWYRYSSTADIWGFIKGKRQPGKTPYTDLIFKQ
ncbi:MAG: hypothetical protein ABI367_01195 [Mucilaginibacter sp.]